MPVTDSESNEDVASAECKMTARDLYAHVTN